MNRHSFHHCSSVEESINRQVGPRSPLFRSLSHPVRDDRNVNIYDTVQLSINRQVGPRSPLYCHACDTIYVPSGECSPAEETISRQVGPRSSLYCR